MPEELNVTYRYMDTAADRQHLVDDLHRVRLAVLQIANIVPQDKWYEPRYHNWSLAAMLGHLQMMDRLLLINIELALVGIRFPVPLTLLNYLNDSTARIFQKRVVETTIRGIHNTERHIADFITRLPMDKFTVQVYHPPTNKYLTIEQAVQVFFLTHWQNHLQTMCEVEGIPYEPPSGDSLI